MAVPIATGERIHSRTEYCDLLALRAADVIQPDIGHFGGLLETKKLAALAELSHVRVAPHNVAGPVATAAALHFAAVVGRFALEDEGFGFEGAFAFCSSSSSSSSSSGLVRPR